MNELSEILSIDAIDADLQVGGKKALFSQLGAAASRLTGLPAREIVATLTERERLGSTGFGGGVAIPHGKSEGIGHVFGYFARLSQPIGYEAIDGLPVDLVFLLLSPPDAGADHLKALAGVSRALRDRSLTDKLRGARSKDAVFAVLVGVEARDAA